MLKEEKIGEKSLFTFRPERARSNFRAGQGLETRIRILEDTNEKSADAEREIESYKKERAEW